MCVCFVQQENKNEALYLREHRGELVEELAKTIVEKVRGERTSGLPTDVRNQAAVDGASASRAASAAARLRPLWVKTTALFLSDYQQEENLGRHQGRI